MVGRLRFEPQNGNKGAWPGNVPVGLMGVIAISAMSMAGRRLKSAVTARQKGVWRVMSPVGLGR